MAMARMVANMRKSKYMMRVHTDMARGDTSSRSFLPPAGDGPLSPCLLYTSDAADEL